MKPFFVMCTLLLFIQPALSVEKVVVWERNYNKPFFKETLQNLAQLSDEEFGQLNIVPSAKMEQGRAFSELIKGNIDIFIAAADIERETLAKVIYVPLDRGLLGFRLCLVNDKAPKLNNIRSPSQFIESELSVGLGSHWPDRYIYQDNNFKVVTSPVYESLFAMLKQQRFDCFSRSVNEITAELITYKDSNIVADLNLVFIYPNADFIFISPKNIKLHERLSTAMGLAIEDNSYFDIFDKYYESALIENGIYERKLMILKNQRLSPEALSAINRFGIASFVTPAIKLGPVN